MTVKPESAIVPSLFRYLPSMEFLLQCSIQTLYDLELAALDRAANHLKTAKLEWEEAAAQREVAGVARWLIETRDVLLEQASRTVEIKAEFPGEVTTTASKKGLDALLGPEPPKKEGALPPRARPIHIPENLTKKQGKP